MTENPSKVWAMWLDDLRFLRYLPDSMLRMHIGFGYLLAAPIERDLWDTQHFWRTGHDAAGRDRQSDLLRIVGDDMRFLVSEPDPSKERFSRPVKVNDSVVWVNADTLRTQVEISNLAALGFLDQPGLRCIEVGGGYGMMAHSMLRLAPGCSYVVVDLPDVLDIISRWIRLVAPDVPIFRGVPISKDPHPGELHLVDATQPFRALSGDLLVNVNSWAEMSSEQVSHYLDTSVISTAFVYSHNLEEQPDNQELDKPISEMLESAGRCFVWEDNLDAQGDSFGNDPRKKLIVVNRTQEDWKPGKDATRVRLSDGYQPMLSRNNV